MKTRIAMAIFALGLGLIILQQRQIQRLETQIAVARVEGQPFVISSAPPSLLAAASAIRPSDGGFNVALWKKHLADRGIPREIKHLAELTEAMSTLSDEELLAVFQSERWLMERVALILLTERDPRFALSCAIKDGQVHLYPLAVMAETDLAAAQRWAEEHRDEMSDENRASVAVVLGRNLAIRDPARWSREWLRQEPGLWRGAAIEGTIQGLPSKAHQRALRDEIAKLKDGELRRKADHTFVRCGLDQFGFTEAATRLHEVEVPPNERSRLFEDILSEGFDSTPEQVLAWLFENVEEAQRNRHLPKAVAAWAWRDPNRAGEWLGALPPSPLRDKSVAFFARAVANTDLESALHWAETIADESLRKETLQRAALNAR